MTAQTTARRDVVAFLLDETVRYEQELERELLQRSIENGAFTILCPAPRSWRVIGSSTHI